MRTFNNCNKIRIPPPNNNFFTTAVFSFLSRKKIIAKTKPFVPRNFRRIPPV